MKNVRLSLVKEHIRTITKKSEQSNVRLSSFGLDQVQLAPLGPNRFDLRMDVD